MPDDFPRKSNIPTLYHFNVDLILGQGGTGTVYRGVDQKTGEVMAIKLFRTNFFRNRLHQRDLAKTAAKFKKFEHQNIVKIYDFISGDEGECLVLEYVDGPDLKWYLSNRPWNLQELLVITAQICNGLAYLHDQGFVHHDLKPANVLFTRKGQVKLCDFSLCGSSYVLALFDAGAANQVTPMYVAPEIIRKEKSTQVSDLYSLGIMLYLMFTQQFPFTVDSLQGLYMCHLGRVPDHPTDKNSDCPRVLGNIIMKLVEKDPKNRFQDSDELRIALSEIGRSRI